MLFYIFGMSLFYLSCNSSTEKRMCLSQNECVKEGVEPCSVCVDGDDGQTGQCIDIYPKTYISSPSCVKYDDKTCPLTCSGKGECLTSTNRQPNTPYHHPYCRCHRSSYGENCQYDNPNLKPVFSYVKFVFDADKPIAACETTIIKFTFHSWMRNISSERNIEIFVKLGDLSFKGYQLSLLDIDNLSHYFRRTLEVKTVFPYKSFKHSYKLANNLIGYHTSIVLHVSINDQIVFNNSWDVFVKYQYLKCLPKIYITNCGLAIFAPVEYLRSQRIEIDVNVKHISDGQTINTTTNNPKCIVSEKMSWKIWKLSKDRSPNSPWSEHVATSNIISYNSHSLEIGLYEVLIEVTNVGQERSVSNVAYCYIKVTCAPIVAKIGGGNNRMVSPNLGLLLRADESYDPNMPSYDQSHLNIEWTCVNTINPKKRDAFCDVKRLTVSEHYYVPPNLLTPGATYNFTLKVWTDKYDQVPDCSRIPISPKFSFLTIKVAPLNDTSSEDFSIECLKNCGRKVVPSDEIFLKAVQQLKPGLPSKTRFEWNYYKNEEQEITTDSIRIDALRSYILIIKEHSLDSGSNYTVVARIKNSTRYAKYYFETYGTGVEASCNLKPESGIKGFTLFRVKCFVHNNPSKASLTFEFYDKYEEEGKESIVYSGRMLGTSKEGQLVNFRLTRGHLFIYILSDDDMLYLRLRINVTMRDWLINDIIMHEIYQNATYELQFGSIPRTIGAISFIPDIIPGSMDNKRGDIFHVLLGFIAKLSTNDLGNMKLLISTLTNILMTMNKPKQLPLKPHYIAALFQNIKQEADVFAGEIQNMRSMEARKIAVTLLNCLQAGLLCREKQTEELPEGEFDMAVEHELRRASSYIDATIDLIANALSYLQVPGQPMTKVTSKSETIVVWVMESDETLTIPELLSKKVEIPVQLSNDLYIHAEKRLNKHENLALQVVLMEDNIYWWSASDVRSQLVSASLKRKHNKTNLLPIKRLDKPMIILINLNKNLINTRVEEFTSMSGSGNDLFSFDSEIKIHRFDPALRSLTAIKFLYPPTNGSLRVLVIKDFRPDYEIMLKEGKMINTSSPEYFVPYYDNAEPYFLYMGVMPGPDISISHNVTYTFEVNTTVCCSWTKGQWSSAGCRVRRVERGKLVQCECTHFSIFSAVFPFPPNTVDPFADVKLFLTVIYNPFVVGLVILLHSVYLLFFLHLWKTGRHEKMRKSVVILDDNFSYDKVPYLVAVFTGPRINSGTSANVGIQLIGTQVTSRPHILRCKHRAVLTANSDDWFLMYSPEHLGDVEGVHLWHDNSGASPDWLCDKVFVYDLVEKTETLFVIGEWLALNSREFPEVYIMVAAIDDIINIKTLFLYNILLALRESHSLLSCVACHPRGEMPKLHRLNIFMCTLLVGMVSSIMFYVPKSDLNYEDGYQYSFEKRVFYVGIQSLFITVTFSFFVYFLFRKSYKIFYTKQKKSLRVRHHDLYDKTVMYTFENKQRECTGGTLYKNFIKVTNSIIKSNTMEPVRLPNCKSTLKVRRVWLALSWTVFITLVSVSSLLIMLYGLKFGPVRSKMWLSSLLIAMLGDILFLGPLRIIFVSTMVAISLQKIFDLDVHEVGVEHLKLFETPKEPEHDHKVALKRNNPMYKPLQQLERDKMLAREKFKSRRLTVFDFILNIVMLMVLKNLIFELWIQHFNANAHVVKIMTLTKHEASGSYNFYNVRNILNLEEYIHYTLLNRLYSLRWYNGRLLHSDMSAEQVVYWSTDYSLRLLGLPAIRQIRVVPNVCENIVLQTEQCLPRWSSEAEDTHDYGERWKPAMWSDVVRNNSPWRYTERPRHYMLTRYRLYSPSGVSYSAGGYVTVLGPTRRDTERKVVEIIEDTWMNSQTRAVFVEFSVYNVNLHVFIRVTLMVEYLPSGAVLPKAQAMYFRTGTFISTWSVLFVPLIFYNLIRCVQEINRHGFSQTLSQFANVCKVLIACLGILSLILYPFHYKASTSYSETLRRQGFDHYFDFDYLANDYLLLRHVLSLLLCISALHGIALLKTGKGLAKFFNALFLSSNGIFWLTFSTTAIIFPLICIQRLDAMSHKNFNDIIINKKSLGNLELYEFQYLHNQLFVLIKVLSITICLRLFVIHFIYCNTLAK